MAVGIDNMHSHVRVIHQHYTVVLILLQGITCFDHIPSRSNIGTHLVVTFNMQYQGMAVVMNNVHGHVRLYTDVLTLLQGTTVIDYTPSWKPS